MVLDKPDSYIYPRGSPESTLAKRGLSAYKSKGFQGSLIWGAQGYGKSSFALQTIHDLFHNGFGYSDEEAWEEAMERTIYGLPAFVEYIIDSMENDYPEPILHQDDAGRAFAGVAYNEKREWHELLKGMMDTIREAVSCVLMTTPTTKDLVKYVRNYDAFGSVKITKTNGQWGRKAKIYSPNTLPSGKVWQHKRAETDFSCLLPDWVYEEYNEMRRSYTKEPSEKLMDQLLDKIEDDDEDEEDDED